jgi:hypothetical protein
MQAIGQPALASLVGSAVRADVAGAPVELTVSEVSDATVREGFEVFSVLLTGPAEPIAQNTYPMYHEELGEFEMFVVPVGRAEAGVQYEALFNREVGTGA